MMLHYHLAILLLADILESSHYFSLLNDLDDAAQVAENTVMNTLEFGLQTQYTIQIDMDSSQTAKTVPILSFDPYPQQVKSRMVIDILSQKTRGSGYSAAIYACAVARMMG